jgi:hypothetical protein
MNKQKLMSLVSGILMIGTVVSVPLPAYAAGGWFGHTGFLSGLVAFIAQKFGLDSAKVQSAVGEFTANQKAGGTPRPTLSPQDIVNREKLRLDKLVTDKKITTEQETAIVSELTTLRSKYPMDPNQTPDQRKTNRDALLNDWNAWAKANSIDPAVIGPMGGMRFGGMGRGMRNRNMNRGDADADDK